MEQPLAVATRHVSRIMAVLKLPRGEYLHSQMCCKLLVPARNGLLSPRGQQLTCSSSQHRVSSFRLEDPTKPGHRRFIALWLVDPTQRIISTANLPPQQMDWRLGSTFGETAGARATAIAKLPTELATLLKEKGLDTNNSAVDKAKFPPELMEMVRKRFDADGDALPMGLEEAKEHRLKLMRARSAFVKTSESGWQQHSYSFCEH
jgi:hypothetical protein